MRQHRRTTVNGKMPENRGQQWRVRPEMFEYDAPWMQEDVEPMMPDFEQDLGPMVRKLPRVEIRRSPDGRINEMTRPKIRMDGRV
jgi:hypothetical protein